MALRSQLQAALGRTALLLLAALFLLPLPGCGYALVGYGSALPEHVKRIGVPMFTNQTRMFRLEQVITQHVVEELIIRGNFEVVPESTGVDALVVGELTFYNEVPTSFSEPGRATTYEVFVRAKVAVADLVQNKVLYENKYFEFTDSYNFEGDLSTYSSREMETLEELAEDFAESLVTAILEGF